MPTRYVVLERIDSTSQPDPDDVIYRLVGVQEGRDLADAAEALETRANAGESATLTYAGAPVSNWHEAEVTREVKVELVSKRVRPAWLEGEPEAPPEAEAEAAAAVAAEAELEGEEVTGEVEQSELADGEPTA